MKNLKIFMMVIIFFSGFFLINGESKKKKIQIELYGGYSGINPAHLNLWPDYREGRDNFYNVEMFRYNNEINGSYLTYSEDITGNYKKIRGGIPFGARIKNFLNPSFALSLGLKYFYNKKSSIVESEYNFNSYYNGEYSYYRKTDPFYIYFEGFSFLGGVHYIFKSSSLLEIEGFLNFGILSASCGMTSDVYSKSTYESGYERENEYIYQYNGKGSGLTAEAGLRANIKVSESLGIFAEGGYSFLRVTNITGEGSYKHAEKDSNSDGYTESSNWTGTWRIVEGSIEREWGTWNYSYYYPSGYNKNAKNFILDLSGFFLRIGISLKF